MLNKLSSAKGSRKKRTRVGRGNSAGKGTTAGSGTKGQQSRAGRGRNFGFEGGQTSILLRQPKLGGFRNPNKKEYEVFNLGDLKKIPAGSYDISSLKKARLIRTKKPVKLLGRGEVEGKYALTVNAVSKSAKKAVEAAGGSVKLTINNG
ncbi:MAG: 50S ribosomal protein L15 [Candidatus Peribacteraceae bacterium]|jgi:large subunit ribosomal protein L15|nr:50S ribosomal protein L15 [Candidatus Peribacteraceae bacterium]MDP7454124.1 50S ribosomal protein L15 [Candidatus Peribacteraceae bacterium]|tara:strand:- start:642 stop:1088 length:447 start_codon:yes stop_codon:yes gene_type:complete